MTLKEASEKRIKTGITQQAAGTMMGVAQTAVSVIELGRASPQLTDNYIKLMEKSEDELKKMAQDHGFGVRSNLQTYTPKSHQSGLGIQKRSALSPSDGPVDPRNLTRMRVQRGLTQDEASRVTGASRSSISKWELGRITGRSEFRLEQYIKALLKIPSHFPEDPEPVQLPIPFTPPAPTAPVAAPAPVVVPAPKPAPAPTPRPATVQPGISGLFVPAGDDCAKRIKLDGKTMYVFSLVPGGVFIAEVGEFKA